MRYHELLEGRYEDMPVGHITDNTGAELEVHTTKVTHDDGSVQFEYKVKAPGSPRGVNMAGATSTRKHNYMMHVHVHDEFQGRGIANALYDYIEQQRGKKLEPNWALTQDGEKFWKKRLARTAV
jgi:ribosomal protein S18 acetylase RimI-like enzyme